MFGNIDSTMILAILPEILLLILAGFVLVFDLFWPEEKRRNLGWLTAGGLILTIVVSLAIAAPSGGSQLVWGDMLRFDWLRVTFK